jgi:hypothetical protein
LFSPPQIGQAMSKADGRDELDLGDKTEDRAATPATSCCCVFPSIPPIPSIGFAKK